MSSPVIMSILARCLLDPAFLARFDKDPMGAADEYSLDEQTRSELIELKIDRLRNFGGFITKVQHHYLWKSFPKTLSLLTHYGIELKVFAAYRSIVQQSRDSYRVTQDEKIERFLNFLEGFLESKDGAQYVGVREVLIHEKVRWEIELMSFEGKPSRPQHLVSDLSTLTSRQFDRLVPSVRGMLRIYEFNYNPLEIISSLSDGEFKPDQITPYQRVFAYWIDSATNELRVLELEPVTSVLLSQVDGHRSIRAIIRRVASKFAGGIKLSQLRPFFRDASDAGLLNFSNE